MITTTLHLFRQKGILPYYSQVYCFQVGIDLHVRYYHQRVDDRSACLILVCLFFRIRTRKVGGGNAPTFRVRMRVYEKKQAGSARD